MFDVGSWELNADLVRRPANRSSVQRTSYSQPRLLHHVRIDLRRRHVFVTEQFLHRANIAAAFQQMRGETVTQQDQVEG